MATVIFVDRLPPAPADGFFVNLQDRSVDPESGAADRRPQALNLTAIYRHHGAAWKNAFVEWLGALNAANARLEWWAYTSTAKNLLSSPLGNRLFQTLAVIKLLEEQDTGPVYVVGASPAQRAVIRHELARIRPATVVVDDRTRPEFSTLEIVCRLGYQALRAGFAILWWRSSFVRPTADLYVCTYVDANARDGNDAFFGRLIQLLAEHGNKIQVALLAYVLAPWRRLMPRLAGFTQHRYWALFFELTAGDIAWSLRKATSALDAVRYDLRSNRLPVNAVPLLAEAFRWDLAKGGYLHNLLVYRAAVRFARRAAPQGFLYPFENKSLEKALLLGLRVGAPGCRITGYQHSSVTPRHTTLLFAEGEARSTPLPDRIVTAGDVTRAFLERNGHYPAGIFATGCALRQDAVAPTDQKRPASSRICVLLALSSSRFELVKSIEFFRCLDELGADFELDVRPHPEFPLSLLAKSAREWIAKRARDRSGSSLTENLDWCTVVAYVSSTVALEALMRGKPVINIDLGEIVIPDPALESPPLWRRVATPREFALALEELSTIPPAKLEEDRRRAIEMMLTYFRPVTREGLETFTR